MHAWLIAALVVSWVFVRILLFLRFSLVQEQGQLPQYYLDLEPTGVLIGPGGPIPDDLETAAQATATLTATAVKTRDVAASNIVRDGLKAGTAAPNFVLSDLQGKGHSLVDYRGKRVLLVFS